MSLGAAPVASATMADSAGPAPAKGGGPKPRLMVALADPKIVPERR